MKREELRKEVLRLVAGSSISKHQKNMIYILLDTFSDTELQQIHITLEAEHSQMRRLEMKEDRINLKYEMAVNKVIESIKK